MADWMEKGRPEDMAEENVWDQIADAPEADFQYSPTADGVKIDRYLGNAAWVKVPAALGGKTVAAVGPYAFVEKTAWEQAVELHKKQAPYREFHKLLEETEPHLTGIRLPDGVRVIENGAFWQCVRLRCAELPQNLEKLGDFTFHHCKSLNRIRVPEKVTEIPTGCFFECLGLEKVTLPKNLKTVGIYGFERCFAMEKIVLPESLEKFEKEAFEDCRNLRSVVIPSKIKELAQSCFWNCQKLESVQLPDGLEDIRIHCFGDCWALKSLKLPENFCGCCEGLQHSGLETVYVSEKNYDTVKEKIPFIKNVEKY